ncbi:hypothetical protein ISS07_00270 [Candidatus Woesearchaeota archaeon]|nr:hypothetical protein [Candidatus Woesearchaeota archaeon]
MAHIFPKKQKEGISEALIINNLSHGEVQTYEGLKGTIGERVMVDIASEHGWSEPFKMPETLYNKALASLVGRGEIFSTGYSAMLNPDFDPGIGGTD